MSKDESSNKKNTRTLFLGTFVPLLIIIIVSNMLLYFIPNSIIKTAVKSQLHLDQEQIKNQVLSLASPEILNVTNFVNVAKETQDEEILDSMVHVIAQTLQPDDFLYYATEKSRFSGGIFVNSKDWVPDRSWEPTSRDWFKKAAADPNHAGVFSDPYVDAMSGELCVTYSQAVMNKDGKLAGVVAVDLILSYLNTIMSSKKAEYSTNRYIIDSTGRFLTHTDSSKIATGNYFESSKLPKEEIDAYLASAPNVDISGSIYYGIERIDGTPWYIVQDGNMNAITGQLKQVVFLVEIGMIIFGFIFSVLNLISIFKMSEGERKLGAKLFEETQNLVVSAKETAATSQDQSAAVKEIVATMEDSNSLSENISTKIKDVSKVAQKTSSDVVAGVASIEKNVEQLHAIYEANQQTINGMKDLNDKIESIWDIVTLINSVADQTKIIAFNAELEATSAGEAGKKFRIVANEIRRLSDGIIDSIHEIKEKITEIQHSSDSLILASENGTEKITSGYETAKDLGTKFESIKSSSEITASSAEDITGIIQQQTIASEQILIALKQISAGIENFTVATNNISASSENLRIVSEELNNKVQIDLDKKKKAKAE